MKPLNRKERSKAYLKVTGWFTLCFVLAILLGFSTMNVNKVTDYTCRKQLEELKSNLRFQETVFCPGIQEATLRLQDFSDYKEKKLVPGDIATSIEATLGKIKAEWTVDEKDQQYLMYKNIIDVYFKLESQYLNSLKMEEQLHARELAGQSNAGELQLQLKKKDDIEKENLILKSDKESLMSASEKLQGQNTSLQNQLKEMQSQHEKIQAQLKKCRDSLTVCLKENRGYKQERR
jgi:hypothetical protein